MGTPSQNGNAITLIAITIIVVCGALIAIELVKEPLERVLREGITINLKVQTEQLKNE